MKNKQRKTIVSATVFASFLILGLISTLTFAPAIKSNAAESSAEVETIVRPVLAITTDESLLNFTLSPLSGGSSESKPVIATVDTNSTGGYELYFSSEDNATAMTSTTASDTIVSDFNSAVTLANMGVNKWGYSLDNTNFNKIPTLANQTKIKDLDHYPTSNERNTTVNIGIKIDDTIDSGVYSKVVKFSAIAHASPTPNLNRLVDLTSMQDPNLAQYCADTYTPTKDATEIDWDRTFFGDLVPRASVQDSRDGKYYLISKLADGHCWMSQNLELALDSTTPLTNEKTDLNSKASWTPENSTLTEVPTSTTWPKSNSTASSAAYSYYPIASDRYYQGGITKSSTPTASTTEYNWEKAGTYYNWYAATAGSGTYVMTSGSATDSICPKGWMLPLGTTDNKSFYYLLTTKYGASAANMITSPLNFLRAGLYGYGSSAMNVQGSSGSFWSSTADSQVRAYNLMFNSSYVNPQDYYGKGAGFPVRCVAR